MKKLTLILTALCFSLPALSAGKYSCDDSIPYCKQMRSCKQARFYLNQCGAGRLDSDNDGVPCGKGKNVTNIYKLFFN
ncbi:cold-shock protein [Avibacterium gallinarum]|uniref:Excalibur calcium-binding domain n=1 Tax=Avibacterium gallinarum TaxID=755 RepID=A0A379AV96_AVIGA|nr:excalibur calcium-binding domain-containing protein [Avibacterium gallinarum]POY45418.1 cold-shock protein [Avibacterium gallinarum]TDP28565.1 excalibur calcium-binding domain-containing protein [Avibacterium gallinarum]SUB26255.1 Excalibur calcium-binding domain [Avibacterium gallinarum]